MESIDQLVKEIIEEAIDDLKADINLMSMYPRDQPIYNYRDQQDAIIINTSLHKLVFPVTREYIPAPHMVKATAKSMGINDNRVKEYMFKNKNRLNRC